MKKIKISKSVWDSLSKKAQAQAAPATTPTKTPVKTPTTPTKDPGKKSPFNPPRPKVDPEPKAKTEENADDLKKNSFASSIDSLVKMSKTYEEGAHNSVQEFWRNIPEDHPFSRNEIFKEYGHNLSQEGYDHIVKKMEEGREQEPRNMQAAMVEVSGIIKKILQLEAEHSDELIDEAKNITAQIWGIDRAQLDAMLGQGEIEDGGEEQEEQEEQEEEPVEINDTLRSEINKRQIINAMTHGSALHAMQSVHHLIAEKINNISPELLKLYTRLSNITTHHYYIIDINQIVKMMGAQLKGAALGWSKVDFKEETPKVKAKGICFPVLCQELFKGVMELISMHGVNNELSEKELKTVFKNAGRLEDEPWLITIGPALWRKFLNSVPQDVNMSDLIMKLSEESPKDLDKIIKAVIQNPVLAKQYMGKYVEKAPTYQEKNDNDAPEIPDDFGSDFPDIPDDFGDPKYFKK